MDRFIPQEEAQLGRRYVELVRARDFAPIEAALDPQYRDESFSSVMESLSLIFPSGEPKSVKVVGSRVTLSSNFTTYNLSYEYEFPDRWIVANILLGRTADATLIQGIHMNVFSESLERTHALNLLEKSIPHYIVLTIAILVVSFVLTTFVACLRTPIGKGKWLWAVFVLVGIGQLTFNWTTRDLGLSLTAIEIPGVGFFKPFYGPILLRIGFPLGAVLFWINRKRWLAAHTEKTRAPSVFQ